MKKFSILLCCLVMSLMTSAGLHFTDSCNANITITASPSDSTCGGIVTYGFGPGQIVISTSSPVTLKANGGVTYLWNTGSTRDTIKINTPGTYTVNGTNASGCTGTATITVYPGIAYNVSLVGSLPGNNLCNASFNPGHADVINFFASYSGAGGGQYRMEWTATGGAVLTPNPYITSSANPTVAISFPDITKGGTIILASTPINIRNQPISCTKIDSAVIQGCPCSSIFSFSGPSTQTICSGQSVTLTTSGNATSYLWSTGATTSSITVSPTTTTTYTVTGSMVPGVSGSCSSSITETVIVNPTPSVTIAASANSICSGNSVTLIASGANTYSWNDGETAASITASPTSTTTYSLTGIDANGCSGIASQIITVNPIPSVGITAAANPICSGNLETLTASGADTYVWNDGETTSSITVTPNPVITNTYKVTGSSVNGCGNNSATINITVYPGPSISVSSFQSSANSGNAVGLAVTGAVTYMWSDGETGDTIIVSPADTITYTVIGTNGNGCSKKDSIKVPPADHRFIASCAYNVTETAPTTDLNACSTYNFTYTLFNNTISNYNGSVQINLPQGIAYNSIVSVTGTGSVSYFFGTKSPNFLIHNWLAGSTITLVISVQTPCVATGSPITTSIQVGACTATTVASSLTIITPTLTASWAGSSPIDENIGNVSEYVFLVTNSSSTTADINQITVNCSADPNVSLLPFGTSYYLSKSPAVPSGTNIYSYVEPANKPISSGVITITAGDFNSLFGTNSLQPGQTFYVHIPYQVIQCSPNGGTFNFSWGCSSTASCSSYTITTNVDVTTGTPSLAATTGVFTTGSFTPGTFTIGTYCPAGNANAGVSFIYKNNGTPESGFPPGSAQAKGIVLYVYGDNTFGTLDPSTFTLTSGTHTYSIPYPSAVIAQSLYNPTTYLFTIDLTKLKPSMIGGNYSLDPTANTLGDFAGDGALDDLFEGGTFTLSANYIYNTTSCPDFTSCGGGGDLPAIQSKYNNECGTEVTPALFSTTNNADAAYSYNANLIGGANIITPTDPQEGIPFTVSVCPGNYTQTWGPAGFDFDCPNGYHEIIFPLPLGYHIDPTGLTDVGGMVVGINTDAYQLPAIALIPECGGPAANITPFIQEFCPNGPNSGYVLMTFGGALPNAQRLPYGNCSGQKIETYQLPCISIPLLLDCIGNTKPTCLTIPANFGLDPLSFNLEYVCNESCSPSCASGISCFSTTAYHHCNGPCTSYFSTDKNTFTFLRVTPPGDENPVSSAYYTCLKNKEVSVSNTASIDFSSAYPDDEIEAKANGSFNGSGNPPTILSGSNYTSMGLQIQYNQVATTGGSSLFDIDPKSSITYTDPSGSHTVSGSSISYSTTTIGGVVYMYFSLPSSITSNFTNTAFTYTFQADIFLIAKISSPAFYVNQVNPLGNLRAQYCGFETSGSQDLSCDSWGSTFTMLQPFDSYGYYPGNFGSYYNNTSNCGDYQVNFLLESREARYGAGIDDFPSEMRPYMTWNGPVTIIIPPGYTYGSSSFTLTEENYSGSATNGFAGGQYFNSSIPITGELATTGIGGTTIKYNGLDGSGDCWPKLDQAYGAFYPVEYISVQMYPTCEAPAKAYFSFSGSYTEGTQQTANPTVTTTFTYDASSPSPPVVYHENPSVVVNPPSSVNDYTNTVTFDFQYCTTSGVAANDPWIVIENNPAFNSLDLSNATLQINFGPDLPVTIFTDPNGNPAMLVYIGSITGSTCINMELTAKVLGDLTHFGCVATGSKPVSDFVTVIYGNECNVNPNPTMPDLNCEEGTTTFPFTRYPSNLELLAPSGFPTTPITLCNGVLTYNLTVNSTDVGSITSPTFNVTLPTGMALQSIQFTYPCPGTPSPVLTSDDAGHKTGSLSWGLGNVNEFPGTIGLNGLTGTLTSPNDQVCITLIVNTDCTYNPNSYVDFSATGISTCSQSLTSQLQDRPPVTGSPVADNLSTTSSVISLPSCTTNGTINFVVTNNSATSGTLHNNMLTVVVPTGSNLSVVSTSPSVTPVVTLTSTTITWNVGPLGPLASQTFSFSLGVNTMLPCPNNITVTGDVTYNDVVSCPTGGSCTVNYSYPTAAPLVVNACCQCTMTASITNSTNVTCYGGNNGTATVGESNGKPGFSYSWAPSGGNAVTASGLSAGTYTVTVTDADGCTAMASVTITQPASALSANVTGTNITCNGYNNGTVSSAPAGGTGPYSYAWSNGAITATQSGLPPGPYTVTVTDANGCTAKGSITITQPAPVNITLVVPTSLICLGGPGVTLTAGGAGTGATYTWTPTTGLTPASGSIVNANPTANTTYVVTGTNTSGCSGSKTVTITVSSPPVATASSNSPICSGGTINLTSSAPGATSWSWTGPNGFTSTSQNPFVFGATAAAAGTYSVTASNSCGYSTATVTVEVDQPLGPVTASSNSPVCVGGTLNLTGTNASATKWSWTGPGGYTSNIQNPVISPVTTGNAGTYTVTASNACGSMTTTVKVEVDQPIGTITASSNSPLCIRGNLNLTASATGATSWKWTGPSGFISTAQNPTISGVTTAATGVYTVTATNACGSVSTTVNVIVSLPLGSSFISSNSPVCVGGSLNLTTHTLGALTYTWSGPGGYSSSLQNPIISPVTLADAGTYTVVATNGCGSVTRTITVVVNSPPTAVTAIANSPICIGSILHLTAIGGTGATSWSWVGPGAFTSTSQNPSFTVFSTAVSGTYTVTATNSCGSTTSSVAVVVNRPIGLTFINSNSPLCVGGTLNLNVVAIGATNFSWSGPAGFTSIVQNPSISGVTLANAGTYTVVASNACGSITRTIAVLINAPPTAVIAGSNSPLCIGSNLSLTATGGTGATSWSWTGPNSFSSSLQNPFISGVTLAANGTYTVTATNLCGSVTSTVTVKINTKPGPVIASSNSPVCIGGPLNLSAHAFGATTYSWSGPGGYTSSAQNPIISPVTAAAAGTYTVEAFNLCGVSITTITVVVDDFSVVVTPTPVCPQSGDGVPCNGTATATVSGGIPPYTYSWSTIPLQTTPTAKGLCAGTYSVTVTDNAGSGCSQTVSVTVPVLTSALFSVNGPGPVFCGSIFPDNYTITPAYPPPVIYSWSSTNPVASGTGTAATIHVGSGGTTITWTVGIVNGPAVECATSVSRSIGCIRFLGHDQGGNDISDSSKAHDANVYPNPANTQLNVEVQLQQGGSDNICLYNMMGEKVICEELTNSVTTFAIDRLSAGIYLYRITDVAGNLIKADKVIITH
jgi:hypothetical protein